MLYLEIIAILLLFVVITQRQIPVTAIKKIEKELKNMSAATERLAAAVTAIQEDVVVVSGVVGELKALIQELRDKITEGTLDEEAVNAAAETLEGADASLDSLNAE